MLPVPHVDCGLGGQVAKNEEQEFIVIPLVGQISGEGLLHGLHDGVLLRVDEALEHHSDGHVHVVLAHPLPQVHLGVGLGDSDHALYVPGNTEFIESVYSHDPGVVVRLPDGDGDRRGLHALPPEVRVHLSHFLLVHLVQLGIDLLPSVDEVLLQQLLGDLFHPGQA